MKRILLSSVVCLSLACFGLAQQGPADAPATKADVERYLEACHVHDMITQTMKAMSAPLHQMIHDELAKDQDKLPPDFEARMNKILDDMLQNMPWDEMFQAMIPAYEKHFTKGDMDALTAFYTSPVGQKILHELPAVTAESMQTMMPIMRKYMDDMTSRIQSEMAQMLKQSEKDRATATRQN